MMSNKCLARYAVFVCFAFCAFPSRATESIVLTGPAGSVQFGHYVKVLANGNYVVVDDAHQIDGADNAGAVTLHRPDGSVISRLHGSHTNDKVGATGIVALPNGDFVVLSPRWHGRRGAATWVDGRRGLHGEVSEENSLVGPATDTQTSTSVVLLANGHYVVNSPSWNGHAGATTWCDGTRGCRGVVSEQNSLYGGQPFDTIGNIVTLPNGNYLVMSHRYDNAGIADVGAITFVDGNRGLVGPVSAANSLVGSSERDNLGFPLGITVLANSDYVVNSWHWGPSPQIRGVGAVTFGSGTQGVTGPVSAANSLVGVTPYEGEGTIVTALDDGGYLVHGLYWDDERGGLVRCAAGAPCHGEWSSQAILRGRREGDFEYSHVTKLPNGTAAFATPLWDAKDVADVGAVTLIDSTLAPDTLLDGTRSLIGSRRDDHVGEVVRALPNGNYVVGSPQWSSTAAVHVGAVTWRDGRMAQNEVVNPANSLVGTSSGDFIGEYIQPLADGSYVVRSDSWTDVVDGRLDVGAITFCAVDAPCGVGDPASPDRGNSLIGASRGDLESARVNPLEADEFLITAPALDHDGLHDVGAMLWARGAMTGTIDRSNALVGAFENDALGKNDPYGNPAFTRHADGSFRLFASFYGDNDPGAIVYGRDDQPLAGDIDADNAVIGTPGNGVLSLTSDYDAERRQMVVGDAGGNRVVLFRPGAATQVTLSVITIDPDAEQPSVRVRIAVTTQGAAADGLTRVQADDGEVCEGVSTGSTQEPEGHVVTSECTLQFESGGEKVLRAEHLGTDHFGYATSAPLTVMLVSANLFRDGFE